MFADPLARVDDYIELNLGVSTLVHLKVEGLNASGSIKHKTAQGILEEAWQNGLLLSGQGLIESSSGSLGCALASICARRKIRFVCVTDINASPECVSFIKACGAQVIVATEPHPVNGLLGRRLELLQDALEKDPTLIWLNQYKNSANPSVHQRLTASEILRSHHDVTHLYVGAGTTGTLMGIMRHLQQVGHPVRVVAVDSLGSSTFGGPSLPRFIPGLGTSVTPEIFDIDLVNELRIVEEMQTIAMCRAVASQIGITFGGSTGTVLYAIWADKETLKATDKIVAVSPDMGHRYLNTIYDDNWVRNHFDFSRIVDIQSTISVTCSES